MKPKLKNSGNNSAGRPLAVLLLLVLLFAPLGCVTKPLPGSGPEGAPPLPPESKSKSVTKVAAVIVKADTNQVTWQLNVSNFPVPTFRILVTGGLRADVIERGIITGHMLVHKFDPPLEPGFHRITVAVDEKPLNWSAPVFVGAPYYISEMADSPSGPWKAFNSVPVPDPAAGQKFFRGKLSDKP